MNKATVEQLQQLTHAVKSYNDMVEYVNTVLSDNSGRVWVDNFDWMQGHGLPGHDALRRNVKEQVASLMPDLLRIAVTEQKCKIIELTDGTHLHYTDIDLATPFWEKE